MKKIFVVMLVMLAGVLSAGEVVKDNPQMFDCPDTAAYIQASKDSREAKNAGDYVKASELTPFSWVAAWDLYNAAGQIMSDKSEAGEWNFCNPNATPETKAKANELLTAAQVMADAGVKAKFSFPKTGKNSLEAFKHALANADEALNGTRCKDPAKEETEK